MIDLRGHAALITGSTKGVGRSIAEAFAVAGCDVVLHGRLRGSEAEEALAACAKHGVRAEFVTGDLTGPVEATVERLVRDSVAALPKIDILVNNAGSLFDVPFLDMDLDRFERTLRLNVTSGYFLTQAFARRWVAEKVAGRVLFVGSINGRLAEQVHTAYDTSKGAVEMMVRTLCVALAPHNIRVNGMAPGLVRTPLTRVLDEQPRFDRWMRLHTPSGEVPHSDVCGPAAVFLASDAAWHIHGQMLLVDGGMSAWQQPDPPVEWQ
jgi:NAD(P)-dependent dehydrogenase (short-subunit alcohol dehydrogenase family)